MAKRRHWSSFQNSNFKFALASSHTLASHFLWKMMTIKLQDILHSRRRSPLLRTNGHTCCQFGHYMHLPWLNQNSWKWKWKLKGQVNKHLYFQFPFLKHLHFVLQLAMGPLWLCDFLVEAKCWGSLQPLGNHVWSKLEALDDRKLLYTHAFNKPGATDNTPTEGVRKHRNTQWTQKQAKAYHFGHILPPQSGSLKTPLH